MPQVAELVFDEFIGPRNKALSTSSEWRWGTNGSIKVNLSEGTWFDHEDQTGGGVLDLLKAFKGFDKPEALDWLADKDLIKRREKDGKAGEQRGKFAGFMDHWPIATFSYFDDKGKLAYEVLKFAKDAPRKYMQRRPHPSGGWIWGLQEGTYGKVRSGDWFKAKEGKTYEQETFIEEARRWLYNRKAVLQAVEEGTPIVLVEGEKDAETVVAWGVVATTNAGGAKYWQESFDDDLAGGNVIICHDNDDPGRQRALLRGGGLKGKAKSVRVLDLALHWKEMPIKGDVTDWKEQGNGTAETFKALLRKAPNWTPVRPRDFGAYYHDEIDGPGIEYDYLVDGLITSSGRSVIGGPSGSGKSFFALHMAYCVARGQPLFGREVVRGGVIYQAGEGGLGLKKRQRAYRKHFQVSEDEDVPLVVLPAKVDLFSKEGDIDRLIATVKAIKLTMSYPLRILFIDTLATATIGADENSGKDMSVVLANIARIEEECGIHVCLVHHMNADGKKLRGHTSIHANVDTVLVVTADEDTKVRTAKLVKQKDDEDGTTIRFSLAAVPVGMNPKTQKEITSCVVVSVSEKEQLKKESDRQGFAPSPTERRLLMNLFTAIDRHGKFVATKADGPEAAIGHTVVEWTAYREVALERMVGVEDRKKATDLVRNDFKRAQDFLIKAGVIGVQAPYMWWLGRPIRGFARTQKGSAADTEAPGPVSAGLQEVFDMDDGQEILV